MDKKNTLCYRTKHEFLSCTFYIQELIKKVNYSNYLIIFQFLKETKKKHNNKKLRNEIDKGLIFIAILKKIGIKELDIKEKEHAIAD